MTTTHNNPLPVAVCAAIIVRRGKVLITLRPDGKRLGGYWEFPGGKMEERESPHQALKRELKEELNIEISIVNILTTVYYQYDWGTTLIVAYLCTWESGEIEHLEVADHRWVHPKEFENYNILPADKPILTKLREIYGSDS